MTPGDERAQVLLDRQRLENLVALGYQDEPAARQLVGRAARDGRAQEHDAPVDDLSVVGAEEARDRPERGRLAGAIGAEERDDRARRHAERYSLDRRRDVVVDDLEVLQLEDGRHDAGRNGRYRNGQRNAQLRTRRQIPTSPCGSKIKKTAIRRPNAPNFSGNK